ncbi:MAG: hypothetical protein Q7T74_01105 [Candidatus Saccharibacteria bacterium]|nr:hypothetical protein [Candidatus Saccharibacteria bacterium]
MPRDNFDSTTEFEAVERKKLLKPGYRWLTNPNGSRGSARIDRRAELGPDVTIGESVFIGEGVTVGEGAIIGDGVNIYRNATIGKRAEIGNNAIIKSDATVEDDEKVLAGAMVSPKEA